MKWVLKQLKAIIYGGDPKPTERLFEFDHTLADYVGENKCPDCHNEGFYQGPEGGMCVNIKCAHIECGSEFNMCAGMGMPISVERISDPSPGWGHGVFGPHPDHRKENV